VAVVMPILLGAITTDPPLHGALLGAVVSALGGLVPAILIWRGLRSGRYQDRFIVRRQDRPRILATTTGLIAAAWIITALLGASRTSLWFTALTVLMAVVATVVSHWWKISVHAMLVAGSAVTLALLVPVASPVVALIPLIIWARHRVSAHSMGQLLAGSALGVVFGIAAGSL